MNKSRLLEILSAPFELDTWRGALTEIFNIKHFHRQPQQIILPANDKAETAYELGSFETQDDRLIGLYQVNVLPGILLERNKVGLRGLLRNVYKYDVDGALIVFVQDKKWRFSYVSEIRMLDENGFAAQSVTNPKRYTYLFGPGESCRTAAERFQLLSENGQINLKDIQDAFSVEKISKQFFKEYKEHYLHFVDYLNSSKYKVTAFHNDEKAIRDFCKKLLGRIVFLYFLQKKGWLGVPLDGRWGEGDPAFLKNLFLGTGANQFFYEAALTTLFFDTLNTERENDLCELIDEKPCRIPYLNGGLFEKESDKYDFLTFPPQLFTDLFAFFDSYNFTIYEDSPEEHTMAVDPEMLGHIFENLLEDNKDKGAYYTPKEIVHYMTQESLIEYLFTGLNSEHVELAPDSKPKDLFIKVEQAGITYDQQKDNISREDIEHFIKQKETTAYIVKNAAQIDRLLDAVKICDPAIGSGAFPMGLLHEIYSAKQILHACLPNPPKWKPAKVKENIIQNSIYGVDIEKGAVDIARLRFWLSLIVDEETPRPLPNLDYKIVVGNSLLPKFEDKVIEIDWDLKSKVSSDEEYVRKIQSLLKQIVQKQRTYFEPGGDKQKQKKEIRDLKIKLLITQLTFNRYRYVEKNKLYNGFTTPTAKERQRDLEIKTTLSNFDRNIAKLKALQGNDKPFEHFDWKLDFPDVMNENVAKNVGFDIVIANPPYIQMQKDHGKLADELRDKGFTTFERTGDIYSLFYEIGFLLLRNKGCLTFITSSQWMRAKYGKSLRKHILQYNPKRLLLLGPDIFDSAVVDTNILIASRDYYKSQLLGKVVVSREEISALRETELIPMPYIGEETWSVVSRVKLNLNKKIREFGKPLNEWDIKIYRGVLTGLNKAFIIDEKKRKELIQKDPKNNEIILPFFRGRDINKYYTDWDSDFLINTHNGIKKSSISKIDVNKYPAIKNHLDTFGEKLTDRADQGDTPYNLRNCAYLNEFEREKIIWKRIGSYLRFSYSVDEIYSLDSTCIATGEKIKYLTGLLNSKLCNYQLFESAPRTGMGDLLISVQALEPLAVYYPTENEEKLIVDMVDKIIERKKQGEETKELENKIDLLVYKLYQLTYDEVLVVDPAFPLSKEEYENYEIG